MGSFADVAQMTRKLDDATCATTPCINLDGCVSWVNKILSVGESFMNGKLAPSTWPNMMQLLERRGVYLHTI